MEQEKKTPKSKKTDQSTSKVPDEKGTGLYNLAEAIGGGGQDVVGNDSPGWNENVSRNNAETKTSE